MKADVASASGRSGVPPIGRNRHAAMACAGRFLRSRNGHIALIVVGSLFLLAGAFHGNVWFDESYSVGIANHSFAEIWRIGAGDVHPVLFYWALHVLNLVFGQNILVYRLFALCGAIALGVLGLTHVRSDFGRRAGLLFSFFAFFTPYIADMSVEIRMYSWAVFAVSLCGLSAWRVFACLRPKGPHGSVDAPLLAKAGHGEGALAPDLSSVCKRASGLPQWAGVPRRWWLVFFSASLASAYLHYFGAIAAFVINALLLAYLSVRWRSRRRALGVFLTGAVLQVALYLPWLAALSSQLSVVSNTYWANFVFPTTLVELGTYPLYTSSISFAQRGAYGQWAAACAEALGMLLVAAIVLTGVCLVAQSVESVRRRGVLSSLRRVPAFFNSDGTLACVLAGAVYLGVFVAADQASRIADSFLLYYRYLFVAIGALLLAVSLLLARVRKNAVIVFVCAVVCAFACLNQALSLQDEYSPENGEPLAYFEEAVSWASEEQATCGSSDSETASADRPGSATPLVLSSDIGVEGVTAVTFPGIAQTYLDWQPGNWALAYEAYAPTLASVKTWESVLDGYEGRFVVLGQSQDGSRPRDVEDLAQKEGVTLVESRTFYRPYERTFFTIALLAKE